jgi:pantothenate kinase-related protein Tda10
MSKPIIQIIIEGPQGSGKTCLTAMAQEYLPHEWEYELSNIPNSDHVEDSYQLENNFHIIQVSTNQTEKEVSDV